MTRHKPRGDGLAYDATRGYRGELVETGGATMDSCGGMIRTAGDGDCGRRDFANSVDRTLLVVVYSGVLCPELPYLRHTRHST